MQKVYLKVYVRSEDPEPECFPSNTDGPKKIADLICISIRCRRFDITIQETFLNITMNHRRLCDEYMYNGYILISNYGKI